MIGRSTWNNPSGNGDVTSAQGGDGTTLDGHSDVLDGKRALLRSIRDGRAGTFAFPIL